MFHGSVLAGVESVVIVLTEYKSHASHFSNDGQRRGRTAAFWRHATHDSMTVTMPWILKKINVTAPVQMTVPDYGLWINGSFTPCDSNQHIQVKSPADGTLLYNVACANEKDMDTAIMVRVYM